MFSELPQLRSIDLHGHVLSSLPPRVFAGLPALRSVDVGGNHSQTPFSRLPDGAFEGLSAPLEKLKLDRVSVEISLRAAGPGRFRAVAPSAAPFNIVLPVTVTSGSIAGGVIAITIAAGSVESGVLEVTRTAGTSAAVTVDIGTLPALPEGHEGYTLVKTAVPLTVLAAEGASAVTLELSATRIAEAGGTTAITARLSEAATAMIELTAAAAPVAPATHADFLMSAARVLTIAAGATESTGTVTVTAVDNERYAGDRTVQVAAAITAGSAAVPAVRTLIIEEDEPPPPPVRLLLSSDTIVEAGGSSLVTAEVQGDALGVPVTLTVTAVPVQPAVASDFAQTGTTLTIAAGQTRSTGTVRITAVANAVDAADKTVRVTAVEGGTSSSVQPAERTLTITDDEPTPFVTLQLSDASIAEDGAHATVTATLDPASAEATTVRVGARAVAPATAGDFVQQGATLRFAAGAIESTGTVRITAVDNTADAPDKEVTVSGVASNLLGVIMADPGEWALTITDDDPPPIVTLQLSADSIGERSGTAAVSAALDRQTSADLTLAVAAEAVAPALATEFAQSGTALTIASGQTVSSGTVTIQGVDDAVFLGSKQVRITAQVTGSRGVDPPEPVTLTIDDDETGPTLELQLTPDTIGEAGETATVTATVDPPLSDTIAITVDAAPVAPASAADYKFDAGRSLTIAAGQTVSTGTVTITTFDNTRSSSSKTLRVTATVPGVRGLVSEPRLLTIRDDEPVPAVSLVLSQASIDESGGSARVTATLGAISEEDTTLRVEATPVAPALAVDFRQQGTTLTVPAGATAGTGTVTVTAIDNDVDAPDRVVAVAAQVVGGHATPPSAQSLTIADDDPAPQVQLLLSPAEIGEHGGVSTVSARLDHPSSEPTTVTVAAAPGFAAAMEDFRVSASATLTIAAGARASTGTVTITAVDDSIFKPNRTINVSGTASNAHGVTDPAGRQLFIEEDEQGPVATLALSVSSIDEAGGTATVTVSLERGLDRATTYTVSAVPVAPAWSEVNLSANRVLTIAARGTSSTGTVTITALNNDTDAPDARVRVTATVSEFPGLDAPAPVALTVTDDDDPPSVRLQRSAESIAENGGATTVTATLTGPSSAATTVLVAAAPAVGAASADFRQRGTLLIVPAGATASRGQVTITAVDNDVDAPNKTVTVTATASNPHGVAGAPAPVTVEIADDDDAPKVRLLLGPASISEDGGASLVTAALEHGSSSATTVTVATAPADAAWYTRQGSTLTIAAGARASTGMVRIAAVNDEQYGPGRTVVVTGIAANTQGVSNPDPRALVIVEDEPGPTVTLALSSTEIGEAGGTATVTASLNWAVTVETTYTVSAATLAPGAPGGFSLGANRVLAIAARQRTSTGVVTITAVQDGVDAPDRTVQVRAAVGGIPIGDPEPKVLTIRDDDPPPAVTLALTPPAIGERREASTVTATLDRPSGAPTTVRVSVAPVPPAVESDFRQSGTTLTIAAGATESTGQVTITSVDNDVDAPDRSVTVSGEAGNRHGLAGGSPSATLTIRDDESAPLVRLLLTPGRIRENGGVSTVTARLDHRSTEATTVNVSTTAVGPTDNSYFGMSSETTLTIAAGARESTGTVLITALDNAVYGPDRIVTVSGDARNTQGISSPASVPLTIEENESVPVVWLRLQPDPGVIDESGGTVEVTVTIDRVFDRATIYTVTATPEEPALASDFSFGASSVLTIAAGATASTGTVTITAVDNDTDASDKTVSLTAVIGGFAGVLPPEPKTLTIRDDDPAPVVTLRFPVGTLDERGAVGNLTAELDRPSSHATRLLVQVLPDAPAVDSDLRLSETTLAIPAGALATVRQVLITAVDNDVDAPDKTMKIGVVASNLHGLAGDPERVALTITDDEQAPAVSLALAPASIVENGGKSTVTAQLDHPSSEDTTVSIGSDPPSATWFQQDGTTLTIAAGRVTSAGSVRFTAVDNDLDADDRSVTVTGTAANAHGVAGNPSSLTLTIEDDEQAPTVFLEPSPRQIAEDGGTSTVTARLDHPTSVATAVSVAAQPAGASWYTRSGSTLTIAAGQRTSTGTVQITAVDDDEDGPYRTVTVTATVTAGTANVELQPPGITIADDEGTPTVWLQLADASIPEAGSTTVSARMSAPSSAAVSMRIAQDRRFHLSEFPTLRIAAGATASSETVTITAPDDQIHGPDVTAPVRTTLFSAAGGIVAPPPVTLTITDNEAVPAVTLELSETAIVENGGETTVTARLDRVSRQDTTVTVLTAAAPADDEGAYHVQEGTTLSIPAGSLWSRNRVRITAIDNVVDGTGRTVTVTGTAQNTLGVSNPGDLTLTISDDEPTPTVTLALSLDTLQEIGTESSTVTASLSGTSTEPVVLTVASELAAMLAGRHFTQLGSLLSIPAGQTESTGTVTITPDDDPIEQDDKTVRVTAAVRGGNGVTAPASRTLTIIDDDDFPTVTLYFADSEVEEGGITRMWAEISHPWSSLIVLRIPRKDNIRPFTLHNPSFLGDRATGLRIRVGETRSFDVITVTVHDDSVDEPDQRYRDERVILGEVAQVDVLKDPLFPALTILDDDPAPPVRLALSDTTISENGGSATVTATLDWPSAKPTTVDVAISSESSSGEAPARLIRTRLTIPARAERSTGSVEIVAVNNIVDAPDATVTVTGSARNTLGFVAPEPVTLTIEDDEPTPRVRLTLSPPGIREGGGKSTVTAALDRPSSQTATVTVTAAAVAPAGAGDFTLSAARVLTIAAGQTASTGTVTITATDNTAAGPHKQVRVAAAVTGGNGALAPPPRTLIIRDDETAPRLTLELSPSAIVEGGGPAEVSAALEYLAAADTVVTVTATAVAPAVAGDFTLSAGPVLTIAVGQTASTGTVTITATDNNLVGPHKQVRVGATVTGGGGVAAPAALTLVIDDDEEAPALTVALQPAAIGEARGRSVVTVTHDPAPSVERTVTVSALGLAPAEAADFTLSGSTLTFSAGSRTSSGTVTITAVDNQLYEPDKRIVVTAAPVGFRAAAPATATLTVQEDDAQLSVSLVLSEDAVSEANGVALVTARLDRAVATVVTVTVTVTATPVAPAQAGDFTQTGTTLTIAAGATGSTGSVRIAAVDDDTDGPDKQVRVAATASGHALAAPEPLLLTIRDDDATPEVTLELSRFIVGESGGETTVTARIDRASSHETTVTVSAALDGAGTDGVAADSVFTLSANPTLTIAAGQTTGAGEVTITALDDTVDTPHRAVRVSGAAHNEHGVGQSVSSCSSPSSTTRPRRLSRWSFPTTRSTRATARLR